MKKSLVILIILIVIASVGWYLWTGRDGYRLYYEGYVGIEPVATNIVIKRLEEVGCTENGRSCHYILDKGKNILYINLYPKGLTPFGPGDRLQISNDKLYASFDISGRRSLKKFEDSVMSLLNKSGNVVVPIDGTWKITRTSDVTGTVY